MKVKKMAVPIAISVMMVAVIFTVALTPAMADPSDVCKDSIRLYGTFGEGAGNQSIECENKPYTDPEAPFFPQHNESPRKDFMTFNPAIMDHNDGYEVTIIKCNSTDVESGKEKVFKRMWYEKEWFKDSSQNGTWDVVVINESNDGDLETWTLEDWNNYPEWKKVAKGLSIIEWNDPEGVHYGIPIRSDADIYGPAIVQEFTYLLTDANTRPIMIANGSEVLIPMAHDPASPYRGLNSFDADGDGARDVLRVESEQTLGLNIDHDGSFEPMDGDGIPLSGDESIVLVLGNKYMHEGDEIQFFDTIVNLTDVQQLGFTGRAIFDIKDNEGGDSQRHTDNVQLDIGQVKYFYRAKPGSAGARETFYLKLLSADAVDNSAIVEMGRMFGETYANIGTSPYWNQKAFMVDGVFYSVAAIMTDDNCVKYMTIRQKLPKFPIKIYGKHLEVWNASEMLPEMAPFCEDHKVLVDVLSVQPAFYKPHTQQDKIGEMVARPPLNITYDEEDIEPRFTGSLLEILDEPGYLGPNFRTDCNEPLDNEQWMAEWFHTYPHQYTNFILPPQERVLVTLSWIAPEAETTIWDGSTTPIANYTSDRVKFWYEDCTGPLYIDNETGSIRVYGTFGEGAGNQSIECENKPYTDPEAPFFPQHNESPRKDFMTFNPAIMDHNDGYEVTIIKCNSTDVESGKEKVFKRMWYEKEWFKDSSQNGTWDVVVINESNDGDLETWTLEDWNNYPEWKKVAKGLSIIEWNDPEGVHYGIPIRSDADIYGPAIVQEFTYLLTDANTRPIMIANGSEVLIPMAHDPASPYRGLNSFDADGDGARDVLRVESEQTLGLNIDHDGSFEPMDGDGIPLSGDESIVLVLGNKYMHEGDEIQFFDTIVNLTDVQQLGFTGRAIFDIKDNEGGDSQRHTDNVQLDIGQVKYFYRAKPGSAGARETFYLKLLSADAVDNSAIVEMGRMFGETYANIGTSPYWNQKAFMVDGVFYSVAAIMTDDNCVKYMTIRQKLPKFPIKIYGKHLEVWNASEMLPEMAPFCEDHKVLVDVLSVQPAFYKPHTQQDKIGEIVARPPLVINYTEESIEPRFTGSLLEILDEPGYLGPNFRTDCNEPLDNEQWMAEWFHTYPHQYTSFVLPEGERYLMTLGWYAPEAETTIWDGSTTPIVNYTSDRAKFWYDPADPTDIYVTKTDGGYVPPVTPDCPGDVSGPDGEGTPDGTVDLDDLFTVLNHWGESGGVGNLIGDPAVDIDDLFEVLNHWGPCPT